MKFAEGAPLTPWVGGGHLPACASLLVTCLEYLQSMLGPTPTPVFKSVEDVSAAASIKAGKFYMGIRPFLFTIEKTQDIFYHPIDL